MRELIDCGLAWLSRNSISTLFPSCCEIASRKASSRRFAKEKQPFLHFFSHVNKRFLMSSISISKFCKKMELKLHSHDFDWFTPYAGVCTAFAAFVSCRLSSKFAWFIRPLLCSFSIANFSSCFSCIFVTLFPTLTGSRGNHLHVFC